MNMTSKCVLTRRPGQLWIGTMGVDLYLKNTKAISLKGKKAEENESKNRFSLLTVCVHTIFH